MPGTAQVGGTDPQCCLVRISCSPAGSGAPPEGQLSLQGSLSWQSWQSCLCHCPRAGWSRSWGCPRWVSLAGSCDTSSWCGPQRWQRDGRVCVHGRKGQLVISLWVTCMHEKWEIHKYTSGIIKHQDLRTLKEISLGTAQVLEKSIWIAPSASLKTQCITVLHSASSCSKIARSQGEIGAFRTFCLPWSFWIFRMTFMDFQDMQRLQDNLILLPPSSLLLL